MVEPDKVWAVLDEIAPLSLAATWDNVGLLVSGRRSIKKVGLCVDLTADVFDELLAAGVDLVVAYHPVVFSGLKRFVGASNAERVVMAAIREGVHIYAPHTALDAAAGGMGEWLAEALGPHRQLAPIEPHVGQPEVGMGRRGRLSTPRSLESLLPQLKAHLGLDHVRVAGCLSTPRETFAVCPGAGGSLFESLDDVSLYLTGEMRHHDVLAKVASGAAVVLTDHTNTERGYLTTLAARIRHSLPEVEVVVSENDADPLRVV